MKSHEEFYKDMLAEIEIAEEDAKDLIANVSALNCETTVDELDNKVSVTMSWQKLINDRKDEIAKQKEEERDQETQVDLAYLYSQVDELQNWLMQEVMRLKKDWDLLPK